MTQKEIFIKFCSIATFIAFISNMVLTPIDDRLSTSFLDPNGSIYGKDYWFLATLTGNQDDSSFWRYDDFKNWRVLSTLRNVFGLLSWGFLLVFNSLEKRSRDKDENIKGTKKKERRKRMADQEFTRFKGINYEKTANVANLA